MMIVIASNLCPDKDYLCWQCNANGECMLPNPAEECEIFQKANCIICEDKEEL